MISELADWRQAKCAAMMRGMGTLSLYAIPPAILSVGALLYVARAWKYSWLIPLAFPLAWWLWKWALICALMFFYMLGVRGVQG